MDEDTIIKQLTTKRLDHLGLIAGFLKQLRIAERIDEFIPLAQDDRTKSTHGQRVVAMIINGLGFCTSPLYMSEQFFLDTPVDILIGENLKAEHFNDDALGRTLDALSQFGTTKLFCRIAFDLVKVLNLFGSTLHLDTTSIALFGIYDVDECDNAPIPTYGHSKDHRPDLKQIVMSLISTGPAGVPVWFESHDGNSSDKTSFHETIKEFNSFTQALTESESFLWVADSALYTQGKLQNSDIKWLTHPPATYKLVQDYVAQPYDNFDWELLTKEYQSTEVKGPTGEYWYLILSGQRRKSALKTLDRRITKDFEKKTKALNALSKMLFGCENDAKRAVLAFEKKNKYHKLSNTVIEVQLGHNKAGRPKANTEKEIIGFKINANLVKDKENIEQAKIPCGRFVLATNQAGMSAQQVLDTYKEQDSVERGFRFIKDKSFQCNRIYLKTPQRIDALMMVMTLCLLVYNLGQYHLRDNLIKENAYVPDQKGKPTQKPTLQWVFTLMRGVCCAYLSKKYLGVVNITERQANIINLMGEEVMKMYDMA